MAKDWVRGQGLSSGSLLWSPPSTFVKINTKIVVTAVKAVDAQLLLLR